jgi:hypothetical protein
LTEAQSCSPTRAIRSIWPRFPVFFGMRASVSIVFPLIGARLSWPSYGRETSGSQTRRRPPSDNRTWCSRVPICETTNEPHWKHGRVANDAASSCSPPEAAKPTSLSAPSRGPACPPCASCRPASFYTSGEPYFPRTGRVPSSKHLPSGRSVRPPPALDRLDLRVGRPREPDAIPLHPRRSLARTSSAETTSPR